MNHDMIFRMGKHTYIANIEEDKEDGGYIVNFPSLQGCSTYGKTFERALEMAKDVLELYLLCLKDEKEPFPTEKISHLKNGPVINIPVSVTV